MKSVIKAYIIISSVLIFIPLLLHLAVGWLNWDFNQSLHAQNPKLFGTYRTVRSFVEKFDHYNAWLLLIVCLVLIVRRRLIPFAILGLLAVGAILYQDYRMAMP
jgi:hypothetical protein